MRRLLWKKAAITAMAGTMMIWKNIRKQWKFRYCVDGLSSSEGIIIYENSSTLSYLQRTKEKFD